jgi:hypothetical protein
MANESTSSTLSELYTEIVAEALFVASEKSLMRGLVKNYAISGGGKAVEVPVYAKVSAAAVSEASDLSNTAINPTSVTITAAEHGIMTTLTDLGRNASPRNVAADIGRLFGESIARKIDTDLIAEWGNSGSTRGAFTATITPSILFMAAADLRKEAVDISGCSTVLHPNIAYDIKSSLTNTFANPNGVVGNEALRAGFIGSLAGIPIYETGNISNTDNAGDYRGAVFHKDAFALAMMQDLKIETQRDASLRADEIVATAVYGVGTLQSSSSIEVRGDSTIE